jgi:hypothetical protein
MSTLSRENRRLLERTVAEARRIAVDGARKVLTDQYAVHHHEPWQHMSAVERELRNQLRAHGRQIGDTRDARRETQPIEHLVQSCAYEHWHRMLFARFLAENDLLLDAEHGVAMTLDDIRELAREQGRDWMDLASELAQRMLLAVFRAEDPVLKLQLPSETRQQLEEALASLPRDIFLADDSLGWVYQFWQRDEKDRVNKSEVKIGADELPAVTQLFTEDYIVLFLLENTLGAWWTARRRAEGKDPVLPGYGWTYLRLNEDGSPAAGSFDGWPVAARDLRVLDPCMGSGHFLLFALPILARMRVEEEGLSLQEALTAALRENLFGLEIDPRCAQIAAFNLALGAWRLAGGHFTLPQLNLACSGLGINAPESDWVRVARGDGRKEDLLRWLYSLFRNGPTLGSLIDPLRAKRPLVEAEIEELLPLIEEVLQREQSDEARELAIAAQGVLAAFRILASRFTLVTTNVPYLGRGKQSSILADYCAEFHADAKVDLATCFVDRCLYFCRESGSVALVTPQNWLFLTSYKKMRERLLRGVQWDFVARLGEHAFDSPAAAGAFVALLGLTRHAPLPAHMFAGWDVGEGKSPEEKRAGLTTPGRFSQHAQHKNPDARVSLNVLAATPHLSRLASSHLGLGTGDYSKYGRTFWEFDRQKDGWAFQQASVESTICWGGREHMVAWDGFENRVRGMSQEERDQIHNQDQSGQQAWGKRGITVGLMRELKATLYSGEKHDKSVAAIIPADDALIPAIWAFCSSPDFNQCVRQIDQNVIVANGTLVKVPFDPEYWRSVAAKKYPNGLPKPHSDDPAQWLFNGHPKDSDHPLQVAVARLVGYLWPRQTGSSFQDCPALVADKLEKYAEPDGIVPLNAIAGESPAADRLRTMLADAYGQEWSAAKLQRLLGEWDTLDDWLRDGFFEEHCSIFHQRPFIWQVWDGRKDGFHALVNYHMLAASRGEGRQTLEKLIYTYLGRWIERQQDEVRAGKEGADARFTAALHLKGELEKILEGEKPHDIFVRWKPVHHQAVGWEPDINDGVRLNIRPWLQTTLAPVTRPKKDACVLRVAPRINYGKDRGKEPHRSKEDYPWFWSWDERTDDFTGGAAFDGARWSDLHYSLATKRRARNQKLAGPKQ